ncbi:T-cell surface glycoprotein CD8 alpha chain [Nematolebias whitei]|uniref:T-cell surface glycoprotein CD8 alpha chain n=1 Tax=Nematolebias whitei TaxID=451745 RepID=UPI0018970FB4|nr:T-cell surface glycoprotein CD8 alpha chain [Nematolebias whitei]
MDPKWIQVLVVLLLRHRVASGGQVEAGEGEEVSVKCSPQSPGTMVIWFRVLDGSGMEFIASSGSSAHIKQAGTNFYKLFKLSDSRTLTLKSFSRSDGGIYSCASLVGGNKLDFGEVTKLQLSEGTKNATVAPAPRTTTQTSTPANTCLCTKKTESPMFCAPIVLAPLAGGCGLLLLLLIVTSVYCNRMRTRRCPHHYKRR